MSGPCTCRRYRTDGRHVARYDAALDCRACWEAGTIRKANLAAGGDGKVLPVGDLGAAPSPLGGRVGARARPAKVRDGSPTPCPLLGKPTGKTVQCPTCRGVVHLKVFACEIFGACTLGTRAPGVPGCCAGCGERPAAPPTGEG